MKRAVVPPEHRPLSHGAMAVPESFDLHVQIRGSIVREWDKFSRDRSARESKSASGGLRVNR